MVIPLCSAELYSHQDTLLEAHLQAVADGCASGQPGDTQRLRYLIGACHDFGKATTFFQEYLVDERSQSSLTNHSAISGLACFHALRAEGFSQRECAIGWLVVTRHHSPLIDTGDVFQRTLFDTTAPLDAYAEQAADIAARAQVVQDIYDSLGVPLDVAQFCEWITSKQYLKDISGALSYRGSLGEHPLESSFHVIELFSQLVAADKLAAAGYTLPCRTRLPSDAVDSYIEEQFGPPTPGTINELRTDARIAARTQLETYDSLPDVVTLTLPTGSGKTLTALDIALQLRKQKRRPGSTPPRIIYALPFTSIIDQNFEQFREVFDHAGFDTTPEILLKHHYRSRDDYVVAGSDVTDEGFWRDLMLTDRWESEVVTTTFVQLLESLVVPTNSQSLKLPNLRNAVVILDEVQAVPVKYWEVIRSCCKQLADDWGCTFIAMTATQPGMFADAPPLVPNRNNYFHQLERVTFEIHESLFGDPLPLEELTEHVEQRVLSTSRPDVLVVCNTIRSAQRVFELLSNSLCRTDRELELAYLSSAVRPMDRRDLVASLRDEATHQRVVVSTQVIEAGVDLDFDTVIRDFAPLDSLVQAAGRCNRHQLSGGGVVEFVTTVDDSGRKPANAIYDTPRLDATQRAIKSVMADDDPIMESVMTTDAVATYFDELDTVKTTDVSIEALTHWQFENARISLIPEALSVDVFVVGPDTPQSDQEVYDDYAEAVRHNEHSRAHALKPDFYDRVVSVNLYTPDSDRAASIQKLPLPDDELGVYRLPAHQPGYDEWYDRQTGFKIPESTVNSRLL